jgi:hypothetical protein
MHLRPAAGNVGSENPLFVQRNQHVIRIRSLAAAE